MRKFIFGVLGVLLIMTTLIGCGKQTEYVFSVDDVKVEKAELIYYMKDNSSSVAAELEQKYNVDSFKEDFWKTEFKEFNPFDVLMETTKKEIVRTKVQQIEAKKLNIDTILDFSEQKSDLKRENEKRKKDSEAGKIIYGPIKRDFVTYTAEKREKLKSELINKLVADKKIVVSEESVVKFYNDNKASFGQEFEKVSDKIRWNLYQEEYEKYVDNLVKNATVSENLVNISVDEIF